MMDGLRCSPVGSDLGSFGTVGFGFVWVGTGQDLVVFEKR